eukprot:Nitzschia sp. Nitz4//scaffold51_size120721//89375//91306//NITZ4_003740-RA/size120721-processed-gene-0.70-mRNA-1//1//CDS//3329553901//2035//frame0
MATLDVQHLFLLPPDIETQAACLVDPSGENKDVLPDECFQNLEEFASYVQFALDRYQCKGGNECVYCGRLGRLPMCQVAAKSELDNEVNWKLYVTDGEHIATSSDSPLLMTLELAQHYKDRIDLDSVKLHLFALGYSRENVLACLEGTVKRLALPYIPTGVPGFLRSLNILELKGQVQTEDSGYGDREEDDEMEARPGSSSLFKQDELNRLVQAIQTSSELQTLDLKNCSFDGLSFETFFQALGNNTSLTDVSMDECDFTMWSSSGDGSEGVQATGENGNGNQLTELVIRHSFLDETSLQFFCSMLSKSTQLQHLKLIKNDWPPNAVELIMPSLANYTALETLDLTGFDGNVDAMESIATWLESEKCTVKFLNLAENPQPNHCKRLGPALAVNQSLIALDLSRNEIDGLCSLADSLQHNKTLKSLDISKTTWIDEDESGPLSFLGGLANANLESLDISSIEMTQEQMSELATSIRQNKSILSLYVKSLILEEGVSFREIFAALADNTTLESLDVGQNVLTADAIGELVSALVSNKSLHSITLSGCNLTDEMVSTLANSMSLMQGLVSMDLGFNQFGKEGASAIVSGMENNRTMESLSVFNSCWSVGGPTVFQCDGYEGEHRRIERLLERNKQAKTTEGITTVQ